MAPAPASFFLATYYSLVLLFLLPHLATSCSIYNFVCQKSDNSSTIRTCGRSKLRCDNGFVQFQFFGTGQWYRAASIEYPERTIKIWDTNATLVSRLQSTNCDFFYNFTTPIPGFHPSWIEDLSSNSTFFNCKPDSYDFSRDVFGKLIGPPQCAAYDLHYTNQPQKPPPRDHCTPNETGGVELELMFEEDANGNVNFSLRSMGFSRLRLLVAQCFSCAITDGYCDAVPSQQQWNNTSCACGGGGGGSSSYKCPSKSRVKRNLAIGFSVAASVLLLTGCVVILLLSRRRFKRLSSSLFKSTSSERSSLGKKESKDPESIHTNYYQTPLFTYKELEDATSGFDPDKELGDGGFGTVYKGKLKDGRVVAVKRLYENNFRRVQQFRNEIEILNRLRHQNLVTLYGCTPHDSPKLMLVYEFVSNGTVADHLHGRRAGERLLTWHLRMSVAIETAEALAYLHAVQPQIVHRDVKTSNILLDAELHVKVADFGLSRLFPTPAATHVSTAPQGTPGYLDPEYHQCYHLTDKSDVYSFGVVLVELLTSMPAVDITRDRNEINLSNIALARIPRGRVGEIVDAGLGYGSDRQVTRMVGEVAEIAFRCLQVDRDMRPSMEEVLQSLRSIATGNVPCGMGTKASPNDTNNDNGNNKVHQSVSIKVHEKQSREDADPLLIDSPPFSPDSDGGTAEWPSRSTTPNASR